MDQAEEQVRATRLIRFVGLCIAFPSLTIALAFWIFEGFSGHTLHIVGLTPIGLGGLLLAAFAARLAGKAFAGAEPQNKA